MKPKVPRFEGHSVQASKLKVSGEIVERVGSLDYGEVVYFVGCGPVSQVAHGEAKGALTRQHVIKATAIVPIDRKDGERMLDEAAMMADERFGVQTLFNEGDGNGAAGGTEQP